MVIKGSFSKCSKEKAWNKFYAAIACDDNIGQLDNIRQLDELVGVEASPFLCFEVFGILLASYDTLKLQPLLSLEITDFEKNVLVYIGGAVLQKLKQRAYRLKDLAQREAILRLIETLSAGSAAAGSMTSILDRGGLIKLTAAAETLFFHLESAFREAF